MTREWEADSAFPDFESVTLPLPAEDDGELVATVLRKFSEAIDANAAEPRPAFLFVHGFVDYFFHPHVAEAVLAAGFDFYALELRRHGRSLRANNRPNYCTDLAQYHAELTAAIDLIVSEDNHQAVVLYSHSTGALVASLYANSGARRDKLVGVVLNSPFFGFSVTPLQRLKLPIAVTVGRVLPFLSDPHAISPLYGESLHVTKHGEWDYDLRWKPISGFPAYFGWVRAIHYGHAAVQRGLAVQCPVLVMHSNASGRFKEWNDECTSRDIVLDVEHMRQFSAGLGKNVERTEIGGAIHDVMLSREPVRTRALDLMVGWLHRNVSGQPRGNPS